MIIKKSSKKLQNVAINRERNGDAFTSNTVSTRLTLDAASVQYIHHLFHLYWLVSLATIVIYAAMAACIFEVAAEKWVICAVNWIQPENRDAKRNCRWMPLCVCVCCVVNTAAIRLWACSASDQQMHRTIFFFIHISTSYRVCMVWIQNWRFNRFGNLLIKTLLVAPHILSYKCSYTCIVRALYVYICYLFMHNAIHFTCMGLTNRQ